MLILSLSDEARRAVAADGTALRCAPRAGNQGYYKGNFKRLFKVFLSLFGFIWPSRPYFGWLLASLGIQLGTQGSWLPWESNWEYKDIRKAISKGFFKRFFCFCCFFYRCPLFSFIFLSNWKPKDPGFLGFLSREYRNIRKAIFKDFSSHFFLFVFAFRLFFLCFLLFPFPIGNPGRLASLGFQLETQGSWLPWVPLKGIYGYQKDCL